MTDKHVLYLGDTSLSGSGGYLAGLMTAFGVGYDYVPSDRTLSAADAKHPRKLFILSDYRSEMLSHDAQAALLSQTNGEPKSVASMVDRRKSLPVIDSLLDSPLEATRWYAATKGRTSVRHLQRCLTPSRLT